MCLTRREWVLLDFFWLGALSKLVATGSTYPFLTIKSRMQTGQKQGKKYKSLLDGITTVIREEGGVAIMTECAKRSRRAEVVEVAVQALKVLLEDG